LNARIWVTGKNRVTNGKRGRVREEAGDLVPVDLAAATGGPARLGELEEPRDRVDAARASSGTEPACPGLAAAAVGVEQAAGVIGQPPHGQCWEGRTEGMTADWPSLPSGIPLTEPLISTKAIAESETLRGGGVRLRYPDERLVGVGSGQLIRSPGHPPRPAQAGVGELPEELRHLINDGNSLRQIEARYGISRKTLHDELLAHGIPIPPQRRHGHVTDRDR
jgi:hypothetical protein